MRPRFGLRGPHLSQGMRPVGMPNGMRPFPPMISRGGPMHYGMGFRPPFAGMRAPMMGPSSMDTIGPNGRRGLNPRMHSPPPRMMPPMMRSRGMPRPQTNFNKNHANDCKVKKKKLKFRRFYVTRPWVNDELRNEIAKKDQFFQQAKASNKAEEWNLFKEQKDKCVQMYSTLKLEYIGQHPEEDVGKIMAELKSDKKTLNKNKTEQSAINRQQTTENDTGNVSQQANTEVAAVTATT